MYLLNGANCWYTGTNPTGGNGTDDIDGGVVILLSPVFDVTAQADPIIRYWRWYSNSEGSSVDDSFVIDINAGQGWTNVETIGPGDPEASGGWFQVEFKVSDFVTPSSTVQMRFRASDTGSGSIVEAAIDDFEILDVECTDPPMSYCIGKVSSQLCLPTVSFTGQPSETSPLGPVDPLEPAADVVVVERLLAGEDDGRDVAPVLVPIEGRLVRDQIFGAEHVDQHHGLTAEPAGGGLAHAQGEGSRLCKGPT